MLKKKKEYVGKGQAVLDEEGLSDERISLLNEPKNEIKPHNTKLLDFAKRIQLNTKMVLEEWDVPPKPGDPKLGRH